MPNLLRSISLGSFLLLGASPVALAKKAASPAPADTPPAEELIDVSANKAKLKVLSDGKSHYVAIEPFGSSFEGFFYSSDGKTFYQQRVSGGGSSGTESFDKIFWDPRRQQPYQGSISFRDKKYDVQCEERHSELKELPAADATKLVDAAKFYKSRWKRMAYALARDNTGKYYYVDKLREPENNKNFRLWVGPKGAMKAQKMTNVVSDSAGDIFATKTGELRLVLNKNESLWQESEKKVKLISLPIDDNHQMIYSELGVYTGEKLGTPCDDL
jgi:hypothetical protein